MEIFHVLNRGIEKKNIFTNTKDYLRAIHDLWEFNDVNAAKHTYLSKTPDVQRRDIKREKDRIVELFAFCLMPNHYHLLICEIAEDGIILYMKKFNGGYVKYFNIKYDRKGTLFEGRYKSIHIENERHFAHILVYIHLNPLDLKFPQWRERALSDKEIKEAFEFLENYRWSSHLDYLGKKNFQSLTSRDFFLDYFGGTKGYKEALLNWLKAPKYGRIKNLTFE